MKLHPLPALTDNYIWLLHDGRHALVVDPAEADPVLEALRARHLQLQAILVTHHHGDHVGGVAQLLRETGAVAYGPARETVPQPCSPVTGGDRLALPGGLFEVIDVPGHTAGHVAYFCAAPEDGSAPLLFCGDTLFSGGCGRLFEGSPAQMLASLDRLAALPDDTRVCCAHEYTLSNLRFARAVEPGNTALQEYERWCLDTRAAGAPTLPARLAQERHINPFLRSRLPEVTEAIRRFDPTASDEASCFGALRAWKNQYK